MPALRWSTPAPTRPSSDCRDALSSSRATRTLLQSCVDSRARPRLARASVSLVPFSVGLALMDAQVFVPAVLSAQAVALLPSVNFPYITGSPPVKPGQGEVPRDYLRVPYVTVPCTTLSCLTPEGSQEALLVPAQPSVLSLGSVAAAKYSLDSVTPQNREGLGSRTVS